MRKLLVVSLIGTLAVFGLLLVAGCGDEETTTTAADESMTTTSSEEENTTTSETDEDTTPFFGEGETVELIVPFPPGGGFDKWARIASQYLPKYLPNEPDIRVNNVSGGGGVVGTRAVFKSDPDGHTIGLTAYPGIAMSSLTQDLGFDIRELTLLAAVGLDPQALYTAADSPLDSVEDVQNLEQVKFASTSKGGSYYAFCAIAADILGLENFDIVSGYSGGSEMIPAVIRGDVDVAVINFPNAWSYVESGDLKALISFTEEREDWAPDVPAAGEMGYDESTVIANTKGLIGPPDMPEEAVKVYEDALTKLVKDEDFLAAAAEADLPVVLMIGEEMQTHIQNTVDAYKEYLPLYK